MLLSTVPVAATKINARFEPATPERVAKAVLPEAGSKELGALATYAQTSARNLAAIDSIAKRARYIAMLAKRATVTADDVRRAMQESVIPADTKLHRALAASAKGKPAKMTPAPALPPAIDEPISDAAEMKKFCPRIRAWHRLPAARARTLANPLR